MTKRELIQHCFVEHRLYVGFVPDKGVTWNMVHNLLHRLKRWGRP